MPPPAPCKQAVSGGASRRTALAGVINFAEYERDMTAGGQEQGAFYRCTAPCPSWVRAPAHVAPPKRPLSGQSSQGANSALHRSIPVLTISLQSTIFLFKNRLLNNVASFLLRRTKKHLTFWCTCLKYAVLRCTKRSWQEQGLQVRRLIQGRKPLFKIT